MNELPTILNLGCGNDIMEGAVNIDRDPSPLIRGCMNLYQRTHVLAMNVTDLDNEFPRGHFDMVYARYFLEHFSPSELPQVMYSIASVTKTGGLFEVIVPDTPEILEWASRCNRKGREYNRYSYNYLDIVSAEIIGPGGNYGFHKSVWTIELGWQYLTVEGYFDPIRVDERQQIGNRITGLKFTCKRTDLKV